MRRAGFTLIEVSLAVMVGAVILAAAVGMFTTMERADAIATVRAEETFHLERMQRVATQAMGSLLIATREEADEAAEAEAEAGQAASQTDGQPGGQADVLDDGLDEDGQPLDDDEESMIRPRVLLERDPVLAGRPMTRRVRIGHQGLGPAESAMAQRLELTLSAPPVQQSIEDMERRWDLALLGARPLDAGDNIDDLGAIRGAFVLRDERRVNELGLPVFSMWWRPVAAGLEADPRLAYAVDPAAVDGAVLLVENLVWARWRFYKQGGWREEFDAYGEIDLAAYAELELTTTQNQTVAWIFELAWTLGLDPDAEDEGEGDGADGEGEPDEIDPTDEPGDGGGSRPPAGRGPRDGHGGGVAGGN
ncbi:MAG: prepilin-type N-terminal cleavage/methylation domain-containing protein [Planctomycetota bacterium]